jgi:hypothetical protein
MAEERLDFSLLPAELRHLAPLIEQYGARDDIERENLLANASIDELRYVTRQPIPGTRSTRSWMSM